MTATNPRRRTFCRPTCAAGLAALLALAGCKSKDGGGGIFGGSSSPPEKTRDPLVYGPTRIPPQNVPVPDRGGVGSKGKTDPLVTPTKGKSGDKSAVGYSDGPERFTGTYIPSVGSTPAALAAKGRDGEELKIDDNRVPLRPGGGVQPAGNLEAAGDATDALYAELDKYGVKPADRTLAQENGKYVFRAPVPWNGARRWYSGEGNTANEAVKQVLDQIIADRK